MDHLQCPLPHIPLDRLLAHLGQPWPNTGRPAPPISSTATTPPSVYRSAYDSHGNLAFTGSSRSRATLSPAFAP